MYCIPCVYPRHSGETSNSGCSVAPVSQLLLPGLCLPSPSLTIPELGKGILSSLIFHTYKLITFKFIFLHVAKFINSPKLRGNTDIKEKKRGRRKGGTGARNEMERKVKAGHGNFCKEKTRNANRKGGGWARRRLTGRTVHVFQ